MLTALIILAFFVFLFAVVLLLAATKPDVYRVQRTTTIHAEPGRIFPHVNDLHSWSAWSPFDKLDPNMKKTFSGPASGKGAVCEWAGNARAGRGRMEIVDSTPPATVVIKLNFIKPLKSHSTAEFMLVPKGNSTDVTWAMYGPVSLAMKIFQVFVNMDRMIGKDFERGLADLKSIAEKHPDVRQVR
jgi:hypothetical protein